ncbi:protein phosphatase 2C and cyclic nucleotide-binding/kinase domain-containing protein [Iris pallida]|uniref:Protein phosphatase 2C and cyclic nucleotide-binding/kinase domain-containing protein n=1 Tax=Iris pallida TaxID=29817 RepID=A0AAX6GJ24_IRIPA|nr:protein phosphatase 2C and cyclic nucleotide-binding/kinase domain-containing protein [Iris pallida]
MQGTEHCKNDFLPALYIIQKGQVRLTYNKDLLSPNACSLLSVHPEQGEHDQDKNEYVVELTEGSHFGEWTLLGEHINSLCAVSIGDVVERCS